MSNEDPTTIGLDPLGEDFETSTLLFQNDTSGNGLKDIHLDKNFLTIILALFVSIVWFLYIALYNSRVVGVVLTKIINKFIKGAYISIGSLSVSVLSGKIMFRDVAYITDDYSKHIQYGLIIFRWWKPYVPPKQTSEASSGGSSDTRLYIVLYGYELHIYNRSHLYGKLERVFGLDPVLPETVDEGKESDKNGSQNDLWVELRNLIPVVKLDIFSGRVIFGNNLLPTSLSIAVEECRITYTTKPVSSHDHFTHVVKMTAECLKIMLTPSPKYTGLLDEPPRYMGEGFVLFSSGLANIYYYWDEPGLIPMEPESIELANGDVLHQVTHPAWGLDIKCDKKTDICYGPWADKQREHLMKVFYPQDYQPMVITPDGKPGQKREHQAFNININMLSRVTLDILFSKDKETSAVHVTLDKGSYMEISIPWVAGPSGYTTEVKGQLLHVEATTSLQFRSLLETETLEYMVSYHFPRHWNEQQDYSLNITSCKATAYFLWAHKEFIKDLIRDWSSKYPPDLLHFVPYVWSINMMFKEFELLTVVNEYNWVDASSSQNPENSHMALCGDSLSVSFDLKYTEYLPVLQRYTFLMKVQNGDLVFYLPEVYTSHNMVQGIKKFAKIIHRDGSVKPLEEKTKWRNVCTPSSGWVPCWETPEVSLTLKYCAHPIVPLGPAPQRDLPTPEKEEMLLSPLRVPPRKVSPMTNVVVAPEAWDPMQMNPDRINVEVEVGTSDVLLYGSLVRLLIHLKDDYVGEYSTCHYFENTVASESKEDLTKEEEKKEFDSREYRALEVTVAVRVNDIRSHLMKVRYIDNSSLQVVSKLLASEIVRPASAENLTTLIMSNLEENGIHLGHLMSLMSDSPNVLRGKHSGVFKRLQEKASPILDTVGCHLHHVHNCIVLLVLVW